MKDNCNRSPVDVSGTAENSAKLEISPKEEQCLKAVNSMLIK
jgi:hypothetical protein